jgi:hypothetical protein
MSGSAELAALYAAIEESAGLLDIDCPRARIWPILTAYEDAVPRAMIAFRVATDARHEGELDCRISLPNDIDPYAVALSKGLLTATGEPLGTLLADIREHGPIDSYGIDFGVTGGFKKIWAFFPEGDFQSLARLSGIPSMPHGVAANMDFFTRYGLADRVGLIGIDYHHKTVNVYFGELPDACLTPAAVLSMHHDIGLPEPSERMIRFCGQSFGIYTTLSWESPRIERISFSVMTTDPMALPARLGPRIERFVNGVPYGVNAPRMVHAAMTSAGEEYYKLQTYYRWRPHRVNLTSADSATDSA